MEKKNTPTAASPSPTAVKLAASVEADNSDAQTDVQLDERARHELFHQAVRQILIRNAQKDSENSRDKSSRKLEYANLLTKQELKFLLR